MKAPIDDGGSAFPRAADAITVEGDRHFVNELGMTVRQWYAGQALPGVIVATQTNPELTPQKVANECFLYADALIAELYKENS